MAASVAGAGAGDRVIVSSFDFGLLRAFRAAAPRVATGLLFEASWHLRLRIPLAAAWLRPSTLHPHLGLCTPVRLAGWRAGGRDGDRLDRRRPGRGGAGWRGRAWPGWSATTRAAARRAVEAALAARLA